MAGQFPLLHHLLSSVHVLRLLRVLVRFLVVTSVWWMALPLFLLYVPMLTGAQSQPTYPQGLIPLYCSALLYADCPLKVIHVTFTGDGPGVQQMGTPLRMWNASDGNNISIVLGCNKIQHCEIDNCSGRLSGLGQVTLYAIDGSTNLGFISQYPSRCRFRPCQIPNCHGGIGPVPTESIDMKINLRTTLKDTVAHINLTFQQPLKQAILDSLQIVGVTPDNATVIFVDNKTASLELHNICNSQIHAVAISYVLSGTVDTSILEFTLPACSPDTPSRTGTPVTDKTTDSSTAIDNGTSLPMMVTSQPGTHPDIDTSSKLTKGGLIAGLVSFLVILSLVIIIVFCKRCKNKNANQQQIPVQCVGDPHLMVQRVGGPLPPGEPVSGQPVGALPVTQQPVGGPLSPVQPTQAVHATAAGDSSVPNGVGETPYSAFLNRDSTPVAQQ